MASTLFAGAHVLNADDVVRFGHLRMWAERGLIHTEDSRDNSYKVQSVRATLHRMRAIQDMIKNSSEASRDKHSYDQFDGAAIKYHQDMIDAMVLVVEKAKAQGMPSDPSARRDLARRAPKTVVVPGYGGGL